MYAHTLTQRNARSDKDIYNMVVFDLETTELIDEHVDEATPMAAMELGGVGGVRGPPAGGVHDGDG